MSTAPLVANSGDLGSGRVGVALGGSVMICWAVTPSPTR
jgi:hypothetical protein